MSLHSAHSPSVAAQFVVCDPDGRMLFSTSDGSAAQSQERFCRQFNMSWRAAEHSGYEVYECTPVQTPVHPASTTLQ